MLAELTVTGFELNTTYTRTYVDSNNTVVSSPSLIGSTIYKFSHKENEEINRATITGTYKTNFTASSVRMLALGGGGAGGSSVGGMGNGGGGGSGAGYDFVTPVVSGTEYNLIVGGGGTLDSNGVNTVLSSSSYDVIAVGGGRGGNLWNNNGAGGNGGNGGGAGSSLGVSPIYGGQGNINNGGSYVTNDYLIGGGGAGSGEGGFTSGQGGHGGRGMSSDIAGGASTFYGGGGGAGMLNTAPPDTGLGGLGGGGNGSRSGVGGSGINGLGGGGGGGSTGSVSPGSILQPGGGLGGSGVIIIRFPSYIPVPMEPAFIYVDLNSVTPTSTAIQYSFRTGRNTIAMTWPINTSTQYSLGPSQNIYIGGTETVKISAASFIDQNFGIQYELRGANGETLPSGGASDYLSVVMLSQNQYAIQTKLTGAQLYTQTSGSGSWYFRIHATAVPL
jgi:hypothetical protein